MGCHLLDLLQTGLISLEITLLTLLDPGYLATCPNSLSWRCRIMQVTWWAIPVSWRNLSLVEVVPTIAHNPAKCPGTKRIQMAKLTGSYAPRLTAILQDREHQGSEQPDLCSSAQISSPPNTTVERIHHGGLNSQTSIDLRERSSRCQ